ncbi:MAG TPA: Ig-like domain-containing protein [Gemmatimonadaceae bacterium]|nr:Ig-like domain-containing protein [Gemmatimonadaceae bacterium]
MPRCAQSATLILAALLAACSAADINGTDGGIRIRDMDVSPALDTIFVADTITSGNVARYTATAEGWTGGPITGVHFSWSTSNPAVALVDSTGVVHPVGIGSATITASAGKQASAVVVVQRATSAIELAPVSITGVAGDTSQLVATAFAANGDTVRGVRFVWASSDSAVARVDSIGTLRLLSKGSALISVQGNGSAAGDSITVLPRVLVELDAGRDFTCGSIPLGRGYCWGLGSAGQLGTTPDSSCFGDSTQAGALSPCTLVPQRFAPELKLGRVTAGASVACALTPAGQAYCWGDNALGQLGNGSTGAPGPGPATVFTSMRFTTVSAGGSHVCALGGDGVAYCWGNDASGQLGDARRIHSTTPIPVMRGTQQFHAVAISAGSEHTCALASGGAAWCWGENSAGELGHGADTTDSDQPVAVAGGFRFSAISAGSTHSCAVSVDGAAYCWGDNAKGELGIGTAADTVTTPAKVSSTLRFTAITAGDGYTCALTTARAAVCWGRNDYGQLGIGSAGAPVSLPRAVAGSHHFTIISAGRRHACGIDTGGVAYCWGSDVYGALGNELQADERGTPVAVARPR